MDRTQISKFLRMGASIHHISWVEEQSVTMLYGYVVTHNHRVFTAFEFLQTFANVFFNDGWCFTDPFRQMATATLNADASGPDVERMISVLRDTLCKQICGERNATPAELGCIFHFWYGTEGMYRVVNEDGDDYLPGYVYSEEAIGGFTKKLLELGVITDPASLTAKPFK